MKMLNLIRTFLTLGVIVGPLPNIIANGDTIDAVPVMADFNWIVNEVNANAANASLVPTSAALAASSGSSLVGFLPSGTGAVAETAQTKLREVVSVKDFGAIGDGIADDTAAITAAFNYAQIQTFASFAGNPNPLVTCTLYFPPGRYIFNGPALNYSTNQSIAFEGAGRQVTQIMIKSGIYFVESTHFLYSADVRGINFNGGLGAFHQNSASANVAGDYVFEDNGFYNYTQCAIGSESSDNPYWKVKRNTFYGTNTSIGVCTPSLPDGSIISENDFQQNAFDIKTCADNPNLEIFKNTFIRMASGGGSPVLTNIWLVPGSQTIGGVGTRITHNQFGNENLNAADYRILIADEDTGTGTNHVTYQPKLSVSTGTLSSVVITENIVGGIASANALIISWTPNLYGFTVRNKNYGSDVPVLRYGSGVMTPSRTYNGTVNVFEMTPSSSDVTGTFAPEPVWPYAGIVQDPNSMFQGHRTVMSSWCSGMEPSYQDLTIYTAGLTLNTDPTNGTKSAITDAIGGPDAIEFTATSSAFSVTISEGAMSPNRNAWVEFDLRTGSSLPLPGINFAIINNGNIADIAVERLIPCPAIWKRIRIPFNFASGNTTYNTVALQVLGYSAGVATKFQIGRLRFYHGDAPQNPATALLQTFGTFNPGTITTGTSVASSDITVSGQYEAAALGDYVKVAAPYDMQGCSATGYVRAAGNVRIVVTNNTGGNITLASGSWNVRVFKQ